MCVSSALACVRVYVCVRVRVYICGSCETDREEDDV